MYRTLDCLHESFNSINIHMKNVWKNIWKKFTFEHLTVFIARWFDEFHRFPKMFKVLLGVADEVLVIRAFFYYSEDAVPNRNDFAAEKEYIKVLNQFGARLGLHPSFCTCIMFNTHFVNTLNGKEVLLMSENETYIFKILQEIFEIAVVSIITRGYSIGLPCYRTLPRVQIIGETIFVFKIIY